ncbi:MAG: hypothetical protein ACK51L_03045 [bacterium]
MIIIIIIIIAFLLLSYTNNNNNHHYYCNNTIVHYSIIFFYFHLFYPFSWSSSLLFVGMDAYHQDSFSSNSGSKDLDSVVLKDNSLTTSSDTEEEDVGTTEGSDNEPSDGETVQVKEEPPCELCGQVPCDWQTFSEDICEVCDELKDSGLPNNQVRFQAYREYTRLRHGVLRKHDRRPLPFCVRSEIMDCWPDPNGQYVGFQAAIKHASEDSN